MNSNFAKGFEKTADLIGAGLGAGLGLGIARHVPHKWLKTLLPIVGAGLGAQEETEKAISVGAGLYLGGLLGSKATKKLIELGALEKAVKLTGASPQGLAITGGIITGGLAGGGIGHITSDVLEADKKAKRRKR